MNKFTLVLVFLYLFSSADAQMVKVLNLKDGLSNNYVQCILQDKTGYIWMGTRDGLNRFNGYENDVFKEELTSTFIYSLMQDRKEKIWIGTSRGGISIYHPDEERFESLKIKGKTYGFLSDKDVYTMHEDAIGNIWLGTLQGLARVDRSNDTVTWYQHHTSAFSHSFTAIHEDPSHRLWLGTNRGLYTIQNTASMELHPEAFPSETLASVFIRDIKQDEDGYLWIATDEKGILRLNPTTGETKQYIFPSDVGPESRQVWRLLIDRRHTLWAALINGGIYRLDEGTNRFVSYQKKISDVFNSASITDLLEDRDGTIWITSHGDGVCYFNPHKYVFERYLSGHSKQEGSKATIVSAFAEDPKGNIWIGTDGSGLKKMSKDNIIRDAMGTTNGLSSNTILDIVPDPGGLWLATWQGGVDYVSEINRKVSVFDIHRAGQYGITTPNIKGLLKDNDGRIWMASHGGGVSVYDVSAKKFVDPKLLNPEHSPEVAQWGSDILQTRNGDIWVGSHAGLYRYSANQVLQYFPSAGDTAGISGSLIYCLLEDDEGNIWIGTNVSLEQFDIKTQRFENFTRLYGISGNIKCILEDDRHHLWFSTIDRLIELDPVTKSARTYDQSFNVQQGQFYECACMKSSSGKLYFGGTEGFNAFFPDSIQGVQQPSQILLTGLSLFNNEQKPGENGSVLSKSLSETEMLVLDHDQNVVSLEFLSIDYSGFNRNQYSYKMEEFDQGWSPAGRGRVATYTNLDPGTYHFRVKVLSPDNVELSETGIVVKVVPPFWKTIWFRSLVLLLMILSIVAVFTNRLLASRRKRLLLQKLVEERTKEVSDKNNLLEHQAEDLRQKHAALLDQEAQIREQAMDLKAKKELLEKSNQALNELNTTKDRLFSIIAHDLRNPFTSLLGFSRLLNDDFDHYTHEEKLKLVRGMYKSSSGIHSLLENLLLWSKAQQNHLVFSPEKLYFRRSIEEHFDFIADDAQKKHIELMLDLDGEIAFYADRNMLNIVFRNLFSNALKYSPIGGRVEILGRFREGGLEISIRDEGPGIAEGIDLFSVTRDDTRKRDHNHGLGLILCREFVEKHGGTIWAGNNSLKGSYFSFTLPACNPTVVETVSEEWSMRLMPDVRKGSGSTHHELPVVLLAEDDDNTRWYVKQIMFPEFQVIEAVNGQEANALTHERIPDIIVSDLVMPKMDGLEFCKQIKSNEQTSHIPFIMLTAERSDDKKVTGFSYGADDYITKPIEPTVLRARLHNLIESRKRLKSIYQKDITSAPEDFTNNALDQEFLERLNKNIEHHLSNPELNPDHLAREMNMSRTGLYMKVKALTGESVGIYIRNIRLKESKILLKGKQMNISEVAYAVGFNQLPYFTTCFKEAFGMTPSEFVGKR